MNTVVLVKMVPDIVEELEIAPDGRSLDPAALRMIISERDDHALEEALILKERYGGTVTVLAVEAPQVDEILFAALAKGADRAVKITGAEPAAATAAAARLTARALSAVPGLPPADLVLTGVQAIDDLDGHTGAVVARLLELPYVGLVARVEVDQAARRAVVVREYAGGVTGTLEMPLPAVLGIQSAEKPPRYVPVAKIRAAMKTQRLDAVPAGEAEPARLEILNLNKPQVTGGAVMLDGSPEEVAARISDLLKERGLV